MPLDLTGRFFPLKIPLFSFLGKFRTFPKEAVNFCSLWISKLFGKVREHFQKDFGHADLPGEF